MRLGSRSIHGVLVALILLSAMALPAFFATPAGAKEDPLTRTWARTDYPIVVGEVNRTWMWGPKRYKDKMVEEYAESPGGQRTVLYWDKSRMEITNPDAFDDGVWYVSNGLLVIEMITGQLQLGDHTFEPRSPAVVNVAGDLDDPNGPTFATFGPLLDAGPHPGGSTITTRIDRNGNLSNDPSLASQGVTAAHLVDVPGIRHQVASPFWTFMNSEGTIYEDARIFTGPLFVNAYYATGYPITEAYWANVRVGGTQRDVLVQCFERRCLTYTPGNPAGWQVEAGNVGIQYYTWRYDSPSNEPPTDADDDRTLQMGQSLSGTIDPQTDLDTYYFDIDFGQRVSVGIRAASDSLLDSVLTIYAPDGTVVNDPAADDDRGGWLDALSYNLRLTQTGRYKAVVESYSAKSGGAYTISLTSDDGAPTEGAIVDSYAMTDWEQSESAQARWYSTENTYRIQVKPNSSGFLAWNQRGNYGNFSASVYIRRVSPASQSIGCLVVRSSLGASDGTAYRLCIWGNGNQTFGDYAGWPGGTYSEEGLLPFQARTSALNADQWNILKIIASGNRIWFYVNGVLVGDATHNGPIGGGVGILVGAEDNTVAEFEFFNLTIRSVSGP